MKKFKILIALILSLTLMVGCSKTSTNSLTDTEAEESTTTLIQEQITKPEETPEEHYSLLKDDEDYDIDDELRDSMNLYEDFVDEYCDFMITYMNADQNWQLNNMEKYAKYTQGIADCQEAINEALERKDELTNDEYEYIVLVQTRTAQKLLKTATEGLDGK
nr:MAG TPA: lipoprotein [Caudoviricetes sp.]